MMMILKLNVDTINQSNDHIMIISVLYQAFAGIVKLKYFMSSQGQLVKLYFIITSTVCKQTPLFGNKLNIIWLNDLILHFYSRPFGQFSNLPLPRYLLPGCYPGHSCSATLLCPNPAWDWHDQTFLARTSSWWSNGKPSLPCSDRFDGSEPGPVKSRKNWVVQYMCK